jgi:hypothetical protein
MTQTLYAHMNKTKQNKKMLVNAPKNNKVYISVALVYLQCYTANNFLPTKKFSHLGELLHLSMQYYRQVHSH